MEKRTIVKAFIIGLISIFLSTTTLVPFNGNISAKTPSSQKPLHAGNCDLNITGYFSPSQIRPNIFIYFFVQVTDKTGNYSAATVDVHVECDHVVNETHTFSWIGNECDGNFNVMWPNDYSPHTVTITAIPKDGYVEMNWSDNVLTFSNLTAINLSDILMIGTLYNSAQHGDTYTINIKNLFYYKLQDKTSGLLSNQLINVTKPLLGFVGTHFIIGVFEMEFSYQVNLCSLSD